MAGTGFSESSQVSMYNTYQNRVVTARESYNQAVMNYNNAIKDARLQNNAVLAEIAYQSLQQQLELSLQGFQYKNQLILEQANKKTELENTYYGRYMDVLNQINQENALAEEQRQFNQNYALSMQQMQEEIRQYNQSYSLQVKEYEEGIRQFNEEIARLKAKDKQEHQREIQQLELQKKQYELEKQQIAEQKRQFDKEMAEKQRQFNAELAYQKSKSSGSSGGSISKSSGSGGSGGVIAPEAKTYAVNTAYYQGDLNPDAKKYGTYSNGYQPKGISGHGKLSRTNDTVTFNTKTLSGQKQTVTQVIWKAEDGTKWYWEGRQNKYIRVSNHGGGGGKF
jgi:DNA polymerase III alpha subunit (gram-positive type)